LAGQAAAAATREVVVVVAASGRGGAARATVVVVEVAGGAVRDGGGLRSVCAERATLAARWAGAAEQPATSAAPRTNNAALGCVAIVLHRPTRYLGGAMVLLAALAGCGGSTRSPLAARPAATTTSTAAATTSTTAPAPTTTTLPAFSVTTSAVTAADVPYTWRPGCPTPPSDLTMLHMSFWGFDGRPHTGEMVVNTAVAGAVETVFRTLYDARFPVFEMVPEDAYRGDDNAAAAADDTSGFNCRLAVVPPGQPESWSVHAYGEAIDVNDVQNPYVDGSTIIPPAGAAYLDRSDVRPGMAVPGGVLVDAFAAVGWKWGGRWTVGTDYQHFSATGG
jgi:hypothetical protein